MAERTVPLSWWLFFAEGAAARHCAAALERHDFLTLCEYRPDVVHRSERWLVGAARSFALGRYGEEQRLVRECAAACGGHCEDWDSGWLHDLEDWLSFEAAVAG